MYYKGGSRIKNYLQICFCVWQEFCLQGDKAVCEM